MKYYIPRLNYHKTMVAVEKELTAINALLNIALSINKAYIIYRWYVIVECDIDIKGIIINDTTKELIKKDIYLINNEYEKHK